MGSADSRFAVLEYQALRRRRGKLFGGQQKYIRGGLAVADLVAEDEGIEAGAKIVLIQKLDRPLPGAGGGNGCLDAPGAKVGKKCLCPGLEGAPPERSSCSKASVLAMTSAWDRERP